MEKNVELKLRKALAALAEKEKDKTSVAELCKKAGVSRASFYLYYKSLDDFVDKCRIYIINKLYEQMLLIMEMASSDKADKTRSVFNETDIILLKAYTSKNIYWDFAVDANRLFSQAFEKLMVKRWGENYYNEKKTVFEFLFNGCMAMLYLDIVDYNKETYIRNMSRICDIVNELLDDKSSIVRL